MFILPPSGFRGEVTSTQSCWLAPRSFRGSSRGKGGESLVSSDGPARFHVVLVIKFSRELGHTVSIPMLPHPL